MEEMGEVPAGVVDFVEGLGTSLTWDEVRTAVKMAGLGNWPVIKLMQAANRRRMAVRERKKDEGK